jgi:DNA topoisomerase-1
MQNTHTEASKLARRAKLRYINDSVPGIRREADKDGFIYLNPDGSKVEDEETLARIKSLVIPPAWREVWISPFPNSHLQATGLDAKNRKQYRYHSDWNKIRSETKFSKMRSFAHVLPEIRKHVDKHLSQHDISKHKVIAVVIRLMEKAYIRIGNNEYMKKNGSYGLTTLRDRHVQITGSRIRFSFKGKKGVMHDIELMDRRLANIVKKCKDIPGQHLFQYIDEEGNRHSIESGDINDFIHEICGEEYTAKDFRTWAGTLKAFEALKMLEPAESETQWKKQVNEIVKAVARSLGNTPTVCRKYYIHPRLIELHRQGELHNFFKERLHLSENGEELLIALLEQFD